MAEPSDGLLRDVARAAQAAREGGVVDSTELTRVNRESQERATAAEILALRVMGLSISQIAERVSRSESAVEKLLQVTLDKAEVLGVEEMRELENTRLDRAQFAVWADVLKGDSKAIATFLRISDARSKLNGLYAPTRIDMNLSVRQDLERALQQLDDIIIPIIDENIIDAEVVDEDEDREPVPVREEPEDDDGVVDLRDVLGL